MLRTSPSSILKDVGGLQRVIKGMFKGVEGISKGFEG